MRACVIANGLDGARLSTRVEVYERTRADLSALGFDVSELDLRRYFGDPGSREALMDHLESCDLVWATGGNAFTLNMALRQSGFADPLKAALEDDEAVYGGYSAGAVVACSSLRGIERVDSADPADAAPPGYRSEITWEGLALIDYLIIPHYRSDHRESGAVEAVVRHCEREGIPHRPLRDGEVVVIDGALEQHLR